MSGGEKSILTKARPGSNSLRTTVPAGIVAQFNLQERDKLDWSIIVEDGKLVLTVTPIKSKN